MGGRARGLSTVGLSQPQQSITYLGAHRLEARQGADCHTLVIHAVTLGAGHHVHKTVHLWHGTTLCMVQKQVGMDLHADPREHSPAGAPSPPLPMLTFSRKPTHLPLRTLPPDPLASVASCLFTLRQSLGYKPPQRVTRPVPLCPAPCMRPDNTLTLPTPCALTALGGGARPCLQWAALLLHSGALHMAQQVEEALLVWRARLGDRHTWSSWPLSWGTPHPLPP